MVNNPAFKPDRNQMSDYRHMVVTTEDEILSESVSDFATENVKNLVFLKAMRWLGTSFAIKYSTPMQSYCSQLNGICHHQHQLPHILLEVDSNFSEASRPELPPRDTQSLSPDCFHFLCP